MSAGSRKLNTQVGHAGWGANEHFGHDVGDELLGEESVAGLLALAVTGRRLGAPEQQLLADLAVAMTVTDPRIWPLKLTRVVSAYGGCLAALAAANLCIERALVGHWTSGEAAQVMLDLERACDDLDDDAAVKGALERLLRERGRLMGFGVPFRESDERVELVRRCVRERGRHEEKYWALLERMRKAVVDLKGIAPNIGLAIGAVCLDMGMTPYEISCMSAALGQNVYLANAVEGARQVPEVLRRLPEAGISYRGPAPRESRRFRRDE